MAAHQCVICESSRLVRFRTAIGERVYCQDCFHGQRTVVPDYSYSNITMCSLGSSSARLNAQIEFFAPAVAKRARVLEIGCATGELAAAARETLDIAHYEAIELSPAAETAAKRVDRILKRPLRELIAAGSIPQKSFDLVIISHVLEHVVDPAGEIDAMRAVLAPGGHLFIEVPNRSGHPNLPFDDNRAHLHFFSAASLLRLLSRHGLESIAARTGVRLDARYPDSLQVLARQYAPPQHPHSLLSDHPRLRNASEIVVWGAGSMAKEVLANFFDPTRIAFFVDRNPAKQGVSCLGRPVLAPHVLREGPARTIILNSIDFAEIIRADLEKMIPGHSHDVIAVSELLT